MLLSRPFGWPCTACGVVVSCGWGAFEHVARCTHSETVTAMQGVCSRRRSNKLTHVPNKTTRHAIQSSCPQLHSFFHCGKAAFLAKSQPQTCPQILPCLAASPRHLVTSPLPIVCTPTVRQHTHLSATPPSSPPPPPPPLPIFPSPLSSHLLDDAHRPRLPRHFRNRLWVAPSRRLLHVNKH
jgi:hypothetical protein